jgi:hypothetical protein
MNTVARPRRRGVNLRTHNQRCAAVSWLDDFLQQNFLLPPSSNQQTQPVLNALTRNPVGAERWQDQIATNPTPGFQPGVEWGGRMVSQNLYGKAQDAFDQAMGWLPDLDLFGSSEARALRHPAASPSRDAIINPSQTDSGSPSRDVLDMIRRILNLPAPEATVSAGSQAGNQAIDGGQRL